MVNERLGDVKRLLDNVYWGCIIFQVLEVILAFEVAVSTLWSLYENIIMCYNFIRILNLKRISYHKTASLVGRFSLHSLLSLGSPRMKNPCRMSFLFLLMPFRGLPCFCLFLCLFSTLPFFSLCLCLCSLSLRTLLLDFDFLWLSEFNFHFLMLIHLLIIYIWRLGSGQETITQDFLK